MARFKTLRDTGKTWTPVLAGLKSVDALFGRSPGISARFVDLSPVEQDEVIERAKTCV